MREYYKLMYVAENGDIVPVNCVAPAGKGSCLRAWSDPVLTDIVNETMMSAVKTARGETETPENVEPTDFDVNISRLYKDGILWGLCVTAYTNRDIFGVVVPRQGLFPNHPITANDNDQDYLWSIQAIPFDFGVIFLAIVDYFNGIDFDFIIPSSINEDGQYETVLRCSRWYENSDGTPPSDSIAMGFIRTRPR